MRRTAWCGLLAAAGLLAGCGDESSGPAEPPPPDLSTPRAAIRALADLYSRRQFDAAVGLHTSDFRFHPAQPESIPFLEPGETLWDFDRETMILERLLVPERISWIDQVLLEPTIDQVVDSTSTVTRITAKTDLAILVGNVDLVHSRSWVDYIYHLDTDGSWRLAEQFERVYPGSEQTYGQLKSDVEEPPSVATLLLDDATITPTGATLKGRVTPNNLATTYRFEWGPTTAYGSSSTAANAGSDNLSHEFQLAITGLTANTEYHYRITATSLWGTTSGSDRTFVTDP